MVLAASVDQLWRVADALADEEDDCTRIVLMLEKWAGVVIEGDGSGRG